MEKIARRYRKRVESVDTRKFVPKKGRFPTTIRIDTLKLWYDH